MPENVGDNREFGVSGIATVTVHFGNVGGKTSADDTATDKYVDNHTSGTKFNVRSDQTIKITKINNITLTDPITVLINAGHTEKFTNPVLSSITFETTVTGTTNVKVRVI